MGIIKRREGVEGGVYKKGEKKGTFLFSTYNFLNTLKNTPAVV